MSGIESTLQQRGNRYGAFTGHAQTTQDLKRVMRQKLVPKLKRLVEENTVDQGEADAILEASDMICHKLGRIANGDPLYLDSWHDIIGYAKLVENILEQKDLAE